LESIFIFEKTFFLTLQKSPKVTIVVLVAKALTFFPGYDGQHQIIFKIESVKFESVIKAACMWKEKILVLQFVLIKHNNKKAITPVKPNLLFDFG
jgi:hypothetical protein